MPIRQPRCARICAPLPKRWLVTDERVSDDALLAAAQRLPRGSGILFRHHATAADTRRALLERLRTIATQRQLMLIVAGETHCLAADGHHAGGQGHFARTRSRGLLTAAVHDMAELARANRMDADVIFLSPVFATRSHPRAPALGPMRFAALARLAHVPVIALGGMTPKRFRRLCPLGAYGWAAIDALVKRQN